MNCSVTLSPEEFRVLHNSLCDLNNLCWKHPEVATVVERIREIALKSAYQQESESFNRKHDHYREVQQDLGLGSQWSLFEVDDLNQRHPYADAEYVIYSQHWGESGAVVKDITGSTWAALYMAADAAIRDSGDQHHSFIESFTPVADRPGYLELNTGS